ncbi:MAG: myo-inosose-2 dehydratase [Pararhizobium sp.]
MRSENLSALPSGIRLAVSPLSWANDVLEDLGADIPVETCLDDAARAGYEGVELGRKLPRTRQALAPLLDSRGLALASGWHSGKLAEGSVEDELTAVAPHADLLRSMGSTVMVYGETAMMTPGAPLDAPMSRRRHLAGGDVAAYSSRLTDFGTRLAEAYGLTLAYHHHLMMVAETFDEISMIFDAAGPSVGLLLDTGHAAAAGFAYTQMIERFGDRIVHIHLKDVRAPILDRVRARDLSFNDGVRSGMFTVPGDGSLDFMPLARFVRESGYRGWLVVEAEQDPAIVPPLPAVTSAFHHILAQFSA